MNNTQSAQLPVTFTITLGLRRGTGCKRLARKMGTSLTELVGDLIRELSGIEECPEDSSRLVSSSTYEMELTITLDTELYEKAVAVASRWKVELDSFFGKLIDPLLEQEANERAAIFQMEVDELRADREQNPTDHPSSNHAPPEST